MSEVASAYVSLLPSMRGFGSAVTQGVGSQTSVAGKSLGLSLGKAMAIGIAAGVGGALVAGKALYSIGSTFDDVSDTIRVGTGATGDALKGLEDSAKRVGKSVPVAFDQIGPALATVNQRLGLTGKPLEKLTGQFLEAGRLTGEALDVKTFTGAFNAFGVKAKDASGVMDELFRVSQATGLGMNDLASSVARNAPNLKQFGFNIKESAGLIGTLDKAGLDSNKTLASLSKAMIGFAKDGKDPQVALKDTVKQIEGFTKSGKDAAAIDLAGKVFGTRGATQFVAAIKSGKVNLNDLTKVQGKSQDTIKKASKDTRDFSEQWQLFKNRAMVTLEPVATRVFTAIGKGMVLINTKVVPAVKGFIAEIRSGEGAGGRFREVFDKISSVLSKVFGFILNNKAAFATFVGIIGTAVAISKVWTAVQVALNLVLAANPIGIVVIAIAALAAGLVYAYKHSEKFRAVVDAVFGFIGKYVPKVVGAVVGFVKGHWKLLVTIIGGPVAAIAILVATHFDAIKNAVSAAISFVVNQAKRVGAFARAVGDHVADAAGFFKKLPGKIKAFLTGLPGDLKRIGEQIIDGLVNGLKGAAHKVTDFVSDLINKIPKKIRSIMGIASPSKVTTYLGRMMGEGLAKGLESSGKKVSDATQKLIDNVRSKLDSLKSDFSSLKDSVAGAFTGNLFDAENASNFISNLLGTKGQLKGLMAAFKALVKDGWKPALLSQLFQSGNAGLIVDLAAADKATSLQAASLLGGVNSLSSQLGTQVAKNEIGPKIDETNKKLDQLIKATNRVGRDVGREINGTSRGALRRAAA